MKGFCPKSMFMIILRKQRTCDAEYECISIYFASSQYFCAVMFTLLNYLHLIKALILYSACKSHLEEQVKRSHWLEDGGEELWDIIRLEPLLFLRWSGCLIDGHLEKTQGQTPNTLAESYLWHPGLDERKTRWRELIAGCDINLNQEGIDPPVLPAI